MKYEYIPKGYNSWLQYQRAMTKRKKVLDIISTVFIFIILVGAVALPAIWGLR